MEEGVLKETGTSCAHLVVLQHGLWGRAINLKYLQGVLGDIVSSGRKLGDQVVVVNSVVNEGELTYDGVDVCGDRLVGLVRSQVEELRLQGRTVTKLSLIGYSLGGLFARYAVGRLYAEGFFEKVEPVNFVTIASPHLGSWRAPDSALVRCYNYMVPTIASRAGYQIMCLDQHAWGKPLLGLMAHPDLVFHTALRGFRSLLLMASIRFDRSVPYCTASICLTNPYDGAWDRTFAPDPRFPSLVHLLPPGSPSLPARSQKRCRSSSDSDRDSSKAKAAAAAADAAEAGGDATGSAVSSRPVVGGWIKFVMLACFPIMVPVLFYMAHKGRKHFTVLNQQQPAPFDHRWLEKHHAQERRRAQRAVRGEAAGVADGSGSSEDGATASGRPDGGVRRLSQGAADAEAAGAAARSAEDYAGIAAAAAGRADAAAARLAGGPPSSAAAAGGGQIKAGGKEEEEGDLGMLAIDGGRRSLEKVVSSIPVVDATSIDVLIGEQQQDQDGIVQLPQDMHDLQAWLVAQLNLLPWRRADVDCAHFHGHAAIVLRTPERFMRNKDVLEWLVENLQL